jgi:hypothetical protein
MPWPPFTSAPNSRDGADAGSGQVIQDVEATGFDGARILDSQSPCRDTFVTMGLADLALFPAVTNPLKSAACRRCPARSDRRGPRRAVGFWGGSCLGPAPYVMGLAPGARDSHFFPTSIPSESPPSRQWKGLGAR